MRSGIYKITNTRNGHVYVGQSADVPRRFVQHRYILNKGKAGTTRLQNAWDKYGPDAFEFQLLESLPPDELNAAEERWIRELGACGEKGYNCHDSIVQPRRGFKRTEEQKAKISAAVRAAYARQTPEQRALHKLAAAESMRRPEVRAKLAEANRIQYSDPAARERQGAISRANADRVKATMAANGTPNPMQVPGAKHGMRDPEVRARFSANLRARHAAGAYDHLKKKVT
jgi:group I intron endonuclease